MTPWGSSAFAIPYWRTSSCLSLHVDVTRIIMISAPVNPRHQFVGLHVATSATVWSDR